MNCKGWILLSTSLYDHVVLSAQKNYGTLHLCVNYRSLNINTYANFYPIPHMCALLDHFSGCSVFSSLNLQTVDHRLRLKLDTSIYLLLLASLACLGSRSCFQADQRPRNIQNCMSKSLVKLREFCGMYLADTNVYSTSVKLYLVYLHIIYHIYMTACWPSNTQNVISLELCCTSWSMQYYLMWCSQNLKNQLLVAK